MVLFLYDVYTVTEYGQINALFRPQSTAIHQLSSRMKNRSKLLLVVVGIGLKCKGRCSSSNRLSMVTVKSVNTYVAYVGRYIRKVNEFI